MLRAVTLSLAFLLLACGGLGGAPPSPGVSAGAAPAAPAAPAATHRLLGIVDPDRDGMVAFALKVPIDWEATQSFTRVWDGAVATPQVTLRLRSPDGGTEIEFRPLRSHVWSEGPMTEQLRQQKRQWGIDARMSSNEREPTTGARYAREVMLPALAEEGLVLTDVRNEREAPEEQTAPAEVRRRGSVDGTLADGRQVRVECRVRVNTQQISSETFTAWGVVPSITSTRGDLEAAHAETRIAQDSIIPNPAWQELEKASAERGYQANSEASRRQHEATMDGIQRNTAAMTAAHDQRMADIQRQGDANTARFNERMNAMDANQAAYMDQSAASDRQQQATIDTIRGESRYADPTTGERVKVEDAGANVYRRADGNDLRNAPILATDAPLDPQQVDWTQLQKLSVQDY